ncbi:MAG: hypothetical protein CMN76_16255 [Spirochaetaceae bacterium]|nr:hypothetical protein [Spirochaetaceae bacterium]|tara:strand:- start:16473 stop:16775 length:303 start_codon:yes stop_codon:yes gene_type:complete
MDLLKRNDGGRAFLRIMKGFELTGEASRQCRIALSERSYPIQLIWGMNDRSLRFKKHGRQIMKIAELNEYKALTGKHFLQEDNWEQIADFVAALASRSSG